MFKKILILTCGTSVIIWGISHLFPVMKVVEGFGMISGDNKNIILMEWINEGFTLIFIGIIIFITTFFGKNSNKLKNIINITCAIMLFGMAILSFFTGFNINFIPFKLCPIIFLFSGICIIIGSLIKE